MELGFPRVSFMMFEFVEMRKEGCHMVGVENLWLENWERTVCGKNGASPVCPRIIRDFNAFDFPSLEFLLGSKAVSF
jgi:hypothetical protein